MLVGIIGNVTNWHDVVLVVPSGRGPAYSEPIC